MTATNAARRKLSNAERLDDLKAILSAEGPCLSVYLPLSRASKEGINPSRKENELHWKECLRRLEAKSDQFGSAGRELLDSVRNWNAVTLESEEEPAANGCRSIAVFRSPTIFRVSLLDAHVARRSVLAPHFYILPLLAEFGRNGIFYLLALSLKNVRLLRCTRHSAEEVPLIAGTATNFDEWMNQAKPDRLAVNNSVTGGTQNQRGPYALAPKGADQDAKYEYLLHFFKQLDRGVSETLKGHARPLVLCATEQELALYRDVNSYPYLVSEEVRGAPNSMKSGEMHARAIDAIDAAYMARIEEVLANWNHRAGGTASNRLKDIVAAAHEGRVLTLLVSDSAEQIGTFDETTQTAKGRETGTTSDEDLLNDAASQTILHAGEVLVTPHNKMPNGAPLAALFRY
jgi:hypothetical protein